MSRTKTRLLVVWAVVAILAARELASLPAAHERIENDAAERLRLVSRATANAFATTLNSVDRVLRVTVDSLPMLMAQAGPLAPAMRQAMLMRHQGMAQGISSLAVSNASGAIVAATQATTAGLGIGDRAYFRLLKATPHGGQEMGLAVSQVLPSRVTGLPSLQVARRMDDGNGRFAGIIVASISVEEHFGRVFRLVASSPTMAVALFDENQRILMRLPDAGERGGKTLPVPRGHDPAAGEEALFEFEGIDGSARLGVTQALDGLPLRLGVSEQRDVLLAPWRELRDKSILFILVLLSAGGGLSALIWRDGRHEPLARLSQSVFEHSREGILITDPEARIIEANPSLCAMTGYSRAELVGQNPSLFQSGRHEPDFYREFWESLQHTGEWRGEMWNRRKDGSHYAQHSSIKAVRDENGRLTHYIAMLTDITALKNQTERLQEKAHHDPLTLLPNRALLNDRLEQALARARREHGQLAVCYIDLDDFKPINDTHGHAAGDRVLIEIAGRLRGQIRGGDTAARLGGDEFVLVLGHLADADECRQAMERLLVAITEPVQLEIGQVSVSASIGIALFPRDGNSADELMLLADQAMYEAKRAGRNRYSEYA